MSKPSKAIPGLAVGDEVWVAIKRPGASAQPMCARVSWVYRGRPAFRAKIGRGTCECNGSEEGVSWWRTEAAMNVASRDKHRSMLECGVQIAADRVRQDAVLRSDAHETLRRTLELIDKREAKHLEDLAYAEATLAEFDAVLAALDAEVQSHAETALAKFNAVLAALDAEVQS